MSLALRIIKHNKKIFTSHYDCDIFESIMWAVKESGGQISIAGIAKYHGISEITVKRRLAIFKKFGLIKTDSVRKRVNIYAVTHDQYIDYGFLPEESIERIEKSYDNCQQVSRVIPCKNTKHKQKPNPIYNKQVIGDYSQYFAGPDFNWDYQESDFGIDPDLDEQIIEPDQEICPPEATESTTEQPSTYQQLSDTLLTEKGVQAGFTEDHVLQLMTKRFDDCSLKYLLVTIRCFLNDLADKNCQITEPVKYLFKILTKRSVYASQIDQWDLIARRKARDEEKERQRQESERIRQEEARKEREESDRKHQEWMKIPAEERARITAEKEQAAKDFWANLTRTARVNAWVA